MQPSVETTQPLPRQSAGIATKAIVGILFLLWTLFLSGITWEIQHSCAPIVSWNGTLPAKCHPKEDRTAQRRNVSPRGESLVPSWLTSHSNQNHQSDRTSSKSQKNRVATSRDRKPSDKMSPNTVGAAAGTAVAIVSAIAGAPAIVTVGLGVAVWFFVKFFAKAASVS
ncbi:hypothetical protein V2H45_07175 [Tumidithrix elongata RA019]|uniref:Uncharacterized protein n=1 Tax=Tumidithrix elongata BACA0141 TaxID=2716417 RepID=A0AAW9PUT9_9CYAN|nr:hypothetical protein [Tumidithrix elongata RA019]